MQPGVLLPSGGLPFSWDVMTRTPSDDLSRRNAAPGKRSDEEIARLLTLGALRRASDALVPFRADAMIREVLESIEEAYGVIRRAHERARTPPIPSAVVIPFPSRRKGSGQPGAGSRSR